MICRLKNSNVQYYHNGKSYSLAQLYKKVKNQLKFDKKTGLTLARVTAQFSDSNENITIVFSQGYKEPELDDVKGKKKKKEPKWAAFLSTDVSLHSTTIIAKYLKRWSIEVCFKECNQTLQLGKDQTNDFNAQVAATSISFLRYNYLNFLNAIENYQTLGDLFNDLIDDSAVATYAHRLYEFFVGLFKVGLLKIFRMFNLSEDFNSYIDTLKVELTGIPAFEGCET